MSPCALGQRIAAQAALRWAVACAVALALGACASIPSPEQANEAVLALQKYERWAWALGIALLWADLLLPIPQTSIIAALGIVYGPWFGGAVGSFGLITSGLIGYGLMRTSARRLVLRWVRPGSLERIERWFERSGTWAIVLSRSLPHSIPEALVLVAGLARMPLGRFTAALVLGSVPIGFVFAAIGAGWSTQPVLALVVSYVVPIVLLPVALYFMRR